MEVLAKIVISVVGSFLTYYIVSNAAKRSSTAETGGKLFFGWFLILTTLASTLIAAGMLWLLFFVDHGGQDIPIILMLEMFGAFAIYGWAEVIWTRGCFDDESLTFQSLWQGKRRFTWSELRSISFNKHLHWYVLRFRHGRAIRISIYLNGHGLLLDKIESLGYDV